MAAAIGTAIPVGGAPMPGQGAINGRVGIRYPSPFFDLAQSYLPQDARSLFRWCRYYAMTYGPVYSFVVKMSSYALTRISWGGDDDDTLQESTRRNLRQRWKTIVEDRLEIYDKTLRGGMHYWSYGNWYTSIHFPFKRYLVCPDKDCDLRRPVAEFGEKALTWRKFRFHGDCPRCGKRVKFKVHDQLMRTLSGMRIKLWNPERVYPVINEATDDVEYYYKPSEVLEQQIRRGERHIVEKTPWAFIRAVETNGFVKFDRRNFLHIKAPSPDSETTGIGHPPILAALKDIFHLQLLKRAQEANAVERTIPLPVVHPAPQSSESPSGPIGLVSLDDFLDYAREEVAQARQDPNYVAFSPVPLAVTHLWGDGRNLLLVPEIRGWTELIIASLSVPLEFIFGGLQWSGSNVSLRMLENQILSFREGYQRFSNFVVNSVANYMGIEPLPHSWKPFKMADDIQMKQQLLMLSQSQKIGDRTLLSAFDLDPAREYEDVEESLDRALELQRKQALAGARLQAEAQQAMAEYAQQAGIAGGDPAMAGDPAAGGDPAMAGDPAAAAAGGDPMMGAMGEQDAAAIVPQIAEELAGQPPALQQAVLERLAQVQPQLAQAVQNYLASRGNGSPANGMELGGMVGPQGASMSQASMMAPQPEQRPPRRGPGAAAM